MNTTKLEKLIWILIFGGLIVLSLGLFVERQDTVFGWSLVVLGGAAAAAGVVLVWVRSRMNP